MYLLCVRILAYGTEERYKDTGPSRGTQPDREARTEAHSEITHRKDNGQDSI